MSMTRPYFQAFRLDYNRKNPNDADTQARAILAKVAELSKQGYSQVGITYSANHDQSLQIRDAYQKKNSTTGISGANQAAVIARVEQLLQTSDFKALENSFRILPISTSAHAGGSGSTQDAWLKEDLQAIHRFATTENNLVLGWQNQDANDDKQDRRFAVGGGVSGKDVFSDQQSNYVQNYLAQLSNNAPNPIPPADVSVVAQSKSVGMAPGAGTDNALKIESPDAKNALTIESEDVAGKANDEVKDAANGPITRKDKRFDEIAETVRQYVASTYKIHQWVKAGEEEAAKEEYKNSMIPTINGADAKIKKLDNGIYYKGKVLSTTGKAANEDTSNIPFRLRYENGTVTPVMSAYAFSNQENRTNAYRQSIEFLRDQGVTSIKIDFPAHKSEHDYAGKYKNVTPEEIFRMMNCVAEKGLKVELGPIILEAMQEWVTVGGKYTKQSVDNIERRMKEINSKEQPLAYQIANEQINFVRHTQELNSHKLLAKDPQKPTDIEKVRYSDSLTKEGNVEMPADKRAKAMNDEIEKIEKAHKSLNDANVQINKYINQVELLKDKSDQEGYDKAGMKKNLDAINSLWKKSAEDRKDLRETILNQCADQKTKCEELQKIIPASDPKAERLTTIIADLEKLTSGVSKSEDNMKKLIDDTENNLTQQKNKTPQ